VLVLGLCITTPMSVSAERPAVMRKVWQRYRRLFPADVAAYYSNDGESLVPDERGKSVIEKSAPAKSKAELFAQRGIKLESSGTSRHNYLPPSRQQSNRWISHRNIASFIRISNDSGSMGRCCNLHTTIYSQVHMIIYFHHRFKLHMQTRRVRCLYPIFKFHIWTLRQNLDFPTSVLWLER